jgi:hypothetical protein
MSLTGRAFLLVLAAALIATVFSVGTAFTYGAESFENARGTELFWLVLALLFASPLWLPALIPSRFARLSNVIGWLSAAALLVPLGYVGSVVLHQVQLYSSSLFSPSILAITSMLALGCVLALVVLLRPTLRRRQQITADR